MTAKQLDTHERWWKCAFFCFAVLLMLDVVYLVVGRPAGGAKIACWLIAAAMGYGCIHAMRQLHYGGYARQSPADSPDVPYYPTVTSASDLTDSVCDNDD